MRIRFQDPPKLEPATLDDLLKVVEGNRTRIRSLASMILSLCGILLSSSFVILFFLLKEQSPVRPAIIFVLFATAGCLLCAAMLSVLSALPPPATNVYGKLELIDALMRLYNREYRRAITSAVFLLMGLGTFVAALVIFGSAYLFRH